MDLLVFPPVCLPLLGQSFGGLDGKVAGEITYFTCLIDSWAGWGLTETNFTSDALKEVEVALFNLWSKLCFHKIWSYGASLFSF